MFTGVSLKVRTMISGELRAGLTCPVNTFLAQRVTTLVVESATRFPNCEVSTSELKTSDEMPGGLL